VVLCVDYGSHIPALCTVECFLMLIMVQQTFRSLRWQLLWFMCHVVWIVNGDQEERIKKRWKDGPWCTFSKNCFLLGLHYFFFPVSFWCATAMLYESLVQVVVCLSVCHECIVAKWCEIRPRLLLITNRKSHISFQMTWKSLTLDDLEGQ